MNIPNDIDRLFAAVLFILIRYEGETDLHTLFKTLYLADRNRLSDYGSPISGDSYIAMKFGPVPSYLYDVFKYGLKRDFFEVDEYIVKPLCEPDMAELSDVDIQCLEEAIKVISPLSFKKRTDLTHDIAWREVPLDSPMNIMTIAKEGGANEEMVRLIAEGY